MSAEYLFGAGLRLTQAAQSTLRQAGDEGRHGLAKAFGAAADDGDGGRQGEPPEVVGLPPDNLVEEIRLDATTRGADHQDRELDLSVVTTPKAALRQVLLAEPLVGDWRVPVGAYGVEGLDGQGDEHLSGEGVVPGMKVGDRLAQLEHVFATSEPRNDAFERCGPVIGGGLPPAAHAETLGRSHGVAPNARPRFR